MEKNLPPPPGDPDIYRRLSEWKTAWDNRRHPILLFLYYLAILAGLWLIYSRGNFATPTFIYQGF